MQELAPDDVAFVRSVVQRIVAPADSDDVAQEALLLAFRHRDQFRGDSQHRTWLYRIATTTAFGHLRRARRRPRTTADGELETMAARHAGPEEALLAHEARERLRGAVAKLQARYREVIELQYDDELCQEDIASQLAISLANVKVRVFRARAALREAMTK